MRFVAVAVGLAALLYSSVPTAAAQSTRARLDDLELRMKQTEETIRGQALVELSQRLDALEAEVRAMRGDLEVLQREGEVLRKQQQDVTKDFEQRLVQLADKMEALAAPTPSAADSAADSSAVPATESLAVGESAPLPPEPAPAVPAERPEVLYGRAFDALKASKFPEAIVGMRDFLARYPAHPLADNAQYWLAQSHYVTRDYGQAIDAFTAFVARSPDAARVPDALLKKGISELELGRTANARATLDEVVKRFPQNDAARAAREQLARLR